MCGRYSLVCTDDLGNRFRVYEPTLGCRSRFNVAPSQTMPVVVEHDHVELVLMEWGLIPHWAKDPKSSKHPINARAETLAERPMFRGLLKHNRCLIPASGFYEWKQDGPRKEPYYISLRESPLFAFAGLYDIWDDANGEAHPTFTIITTEANDLVAPIHNRMPVILRPEDEIRWLSPEPLAPGDREAILGQYPAGAMDAYPVSHRVNSPAVEDEQLIAPLS